MTQVTQFPAPYDHVLKVLSDKLKASMNEHDLQKEIQIMREALQSIATGEDMPADHLAGIARNALTKTGEI